jgi:DNA-binding transcriptional regulator YhcF (GntR family)
MSFEDRITAAEAKAATEREVAEQAKVPVFHLIREAIDHQIESAIMAHPPKSSVLVSLRYMSITMTPEDIDLAYKSLEEDGFILSHGLDEADLYPTTLVSW